MVTNSLTNGLLKNKAFNAGLDVAVGISPLFQNQHPCGTAYYRQENLFLPAFAPPTRYYPLSHLVY